MLSSQVETETLFKSIKQNMFKNSSRLKKHSYSGFS